MSHPFTINDMVLTSCLEFWTKHSRRLAYTPVMSFISRMVLLSGGMVQMPRGRGLTVTMKRVVSHLQNVTPLLMRGGLMKVVGVASQGRQW